MVLYTPPCRDTVSGTGVFNTIELCNPCGTTSSIHLHVGIQLVGLVCSVHKDVTNPEVFMATCLRLSCIDHGWVLKSGCILAAHCTCMAGLGEACSHVAGLANTSIHLITTVKHQTACTSLRVPCSWLQPTFQDVTYEPI